MNIKGKSKLPKDIILHVKTEDELLKYLLKELQGKNRNNIKSLLTNKQVIVNRKVESRYNHKLMPGDEVKIDNRRSNTPNILTARGFSIIFEDEHLIVIDKHAGILSIATEKEKSHTAYNFLSKHVKYENASNKIFIVHRLDRETSGLMIFAKNIKVQHLLQDNWRDMITERTYIAIAEGVVKNDHGVIKSYLQESKSLKVHSSQNPDAGKLSITNYKVLKRTNEYTMLEVRLDTGRKNQIRVHMQEIGHSLIADKKYGATSNPIGRLGLHSRTLGFIHPVTKEPLRFQTVIPRKFTRLF
ncbi:MAG: RluA family pseudouridine synthase [Prolixibacteraceae bacterium]|jgi:23S rRNA pseudouridine1911/1915/1917 synthase|nr:RluA family pseudouridine synthase [Prolixibacteraceae bacterium]